ncbi:MAG: M48 family metallopeptidase [Saprospiraceae bacterium]|nr:M48 family metallopeptidase [Saprospiraceae bacterium]
MLHRKKNTTNITKLMVDVDEKQIPMIIYRERRRSWRVAVGQHSVNLRIPTTWHYGMPENPVEWAVEWTQAKYRKQPEIFDHFFLRPPHDGQLYQTLFGAFVLSLLPVSRKTAAAKISGNIIQIRYPEIWGEREQSEVFPKLVSKVFAKDFHDRFSERVAILNERFYQFHYSDISFKYNKSNWGSCSHTGHLNFSTRLFLAPQIVVDYVIIHELAHLREHNHSPAFWKVVEYAMPRYKDQVSWLKKYGSKLYF